MVNTKLSTQSLANLSSLGKIVKNKSEASKAFQTLPVSRIYSKAQPRTVFERIDELAENMKAIGQQQPIIVSPDGTGRYVIEQGERRWRAAQLAKILTLDCIVKKTEADSPERLIRQLSENIQREEMTLWDLSRAIGQIVSSGIKVKELAQRLGKKESYISALNCVSDLPVELENLVKHQRINDPLALRKLQKEFEIHPDEIRAQISQWESDLASTDEDAPTAISRSQVFAFIKRLKSQESTDDVTPATTDEETDSVVEVVNQDEDLVTQTNDDDTTVDVDPVTPSRDERELPEGCSAVSHSKIKVRVSWHGNEGYLTHGVVPPQGKLCITLATSDETILVDAKDVELLCVTD